MVFETVDFDKTHFANFIFYDFQEPFDPEAFVEKLAKRTMQVSFKDNDKDQLDPIALQETFLQAIK